MGASCSFASLETLKVSGMKEWERWECEAVTGAFPRLQHLSINDCPKLKGHLPEQLVHLKNLQIWNCKQLVASVPMAPEIDELHLRDCGKLELSYHPTTLKRLTVGGDMGALLEKRIEHIVSVNSLKYLEFYSCPNMNIPVSGCYSFLVSLTITDGCDSLTTFLLDLFPTLQRLSLNWCRNLQMVSQGHAHNHLEYLSIQECPKLESLPERMDILLPSLYDLYIGDCPKVESFPEGGLPSNLRLMYLRVGSKLFASMKRVLGSNSSVELMSIERLDNVECLPEEGMLPLSLTSLRISHCRDLKKLDYKGLCHLSSLKQLLLRDCPNLQSLPEEGLPKSISALAIRGDCRMLKQRCQKSEGEDWPKIAHIERLYIN